MGVPLRTSERRSPLISVADSGGTLNYVDTPIYRRGTRHFSFVRVQTWVRRLRIRKFSSLISDRLIIGAINTGNTCPLLAIFFRLDSIKCVVV